VGALLHNLSTGGLFDVINSPYSGYHSVINLWSACHIRVL